VHNTGNKRFYSTYLGGDRGDEGKCLTGLNGKLYLTGNTFSTNFPTQTYTYPGAYNQTDLSPTHEDVFITLIPYTYIGGVDELKILENLYIYPNPNNGIFTINSTNNSETTNSIEIYNTLGNKIYQSVFETNTKSINISNYPQGIYIVKVYSGNNVFVEKVIYN